MAVANDMKGARLEFVLRPLKGEKDRLIRAWDSAKKKIIATKSVEPAGYMLYLPNGHSYRLTEREVLKRGLHRQPNVMNFDSVKDASTPAGQFKFAINDSTRKTAWAAMEKQVIDLCKRRGGGSVELGEHAEIGEAA